MCTPHRLDRRSSNSASLHFDKVHIEAKGLSGAESVNVHGWSLLVGTVGQVFPASMTDHFSLVICCHLSLSRSVSEQSGAMAVRSPGKHIPKFSVESQSI